MYTKELLVDNGCLTLALQEGQGRLIVRTFGSGCFDLPCSIVNLFAVSKGLRYHIGGLDGFGTLEKVGDAVKVRVSNHKEAFSCLLPLADFERALQFLAHHVDGSPGRSAYVS